MNTEETFLIDVALFVLIIAIWVHWHRNGSGSDNGEVDQANMWSGRNTLERIL